MALSIFRNNSNKAILLGLITFLSACGGGGSGNKNSIDSINSSKAETTNSSATISQSPNVSNNSSIISATSSTATQLFAQRLEFLYTTVNLIAGDSLGNIAGGASKGPISYASSNTEIATVNESGVVTAKAPGTAIITETIAADQFYAAASASYTVNVKALANQALSFTQAGPIDLPLGETLFNSATAVGTGEITYTSSDISIASVDNLGFVTAISPGTAIITAKKARDSIYYGTENSFTINTIDNPTKIRLKAWIGSQDTLISLPASTSGAQLYQTSDANCSPLDYSHCSDGKLTTLNGSSFTDTTTSLTKAGYYTLQKATATANLPITMDTFPGRSWHQIVNFKNQLFLLGGRDENYKNLDDAWTSNDGRIWTKLPSSPTLAIINHHTLVVFNNKLWAIGGYHDDNKNDIWSSNDGVTWTQEATSAAFSARHYQQIVVLNNKLWLVGGIDASSNFKNDVWSSTDGIIWVQVTANAPFMADRTQLGGHYASIIAPDVLLSFNNQLWLFRPVVNHNARDEIWSSPDGINWTQQTTDHHFSRMGSQLVTFKNQVWLIGGLDLDGVGLQSDVWSSSDGTHWTRATNYAEFSARDYHQLIDFNNQLLLIGGNSDKAAENDVWASTTGVSWGRKNTFAEFSPRPAPQTVSFNNQIWLIGGYDDVWGFKGDIWSSTDGISWQQRVVKDAFTERSGEAVVAYKNKLWLIGGDYRNSEYKNDIWSSTDGITWTKQTDSAPFAERSHAQLVVHNAKLWLIGGRNSAGDLNDVWASEDGVTWIKQTANAAFSQRHGFQVTSYNNRLWLTGGENGNARLNDIWSSIDGILWTRATANANFSPRKFHQVIVFNNQLCLIGGHTDTGLQNDVWTSQDGINWTRQTEHSAFSARELNSLVINANKLFIIGGEDENGPRNDIWSSSNAIDWRLGYSGVFQFQ